jgi:hypothetical protein
MLLVSAPMVAKLLGRPRRWALRQAKAGWYGAPVRRTGHHSYFDLAAVERVEGITFDPDQLERAGVLITEVT